MKICMKNRAKFILLAICLMICLTACGDDNYSNGGDYQIDGYYYSVPTKWKADTSDTSTTYFYPQNGMLMVSFAPQSNSLSDNAIRKEVLDGFGSELSSFDILGESEITVDEEPAYFYELNTELQGKKYQSQMVLFNSVNGMVCFLMSTEKDAEQDYENAFDEILKSIKNNNGASTSGSVKPKTNVSENDVEVTAIPTKDGLMCVFIKNNSNIVIGELSVQINYKDDTGNTIDSDEDGHDIVLPGTTVVSRMEAPDSYADFEIVKNIEVDANQNYENHLNELNVTSNQGDNCIILETTNNSDVIIEELEYVVVLYSGSDIVSVEYPNDVYDIEPGKTNTEKIDTYSKQYDRFEIYINQAHTFGL